MKILLVKPYNLSDHVQPSIGLGYLAQVLKNKHKVKIVDCIKQNIDIDKFKSYISKKNPDIVGFQTYTYDINFVKEALKIVKEFNNKIITVIGGPHPSCVPKTIFNTFDHLDFGFAGESELSFPKFLDNEKYSEIPGLIYKKNEKVIANPPVYVEDLDQFKRPAWEFIKPETYPEAQHGFFFKKFPIAPIMITRGCPYNCTFCAGNLISGKVVRRRSIENVLDEIKYLYYKRGIREFHIVDDNFTMNRKYAIDFLKELKKLNLDISWATPNGVRMNTLDRELLTLMKETGLYLISLGIESGNDRILKIMRKSLTVDDIKYYVNLIHSMNIDIAGFFIMGFPTETEEEIRETIKLSLELPLIRANFFTYLPFPGTQSYIELEKNGELDNVNWEHFYFMNAAYTPKTITQKKLKYLQRLAFIKFFFRIPIFIKTLSGIQTPKHFMFFIKRFYHWLLMK